MKPNVPEATRPPGETLTFESVLAVAPRALADPATLSHDEKTLLELADGDRPVSELLWMSGLGGTVVMRVLKSLVERGLLITVSGGARASEAAGPSQPPGAGPTGPLPMRRPLANMPVPRSSTLTTPPAPPRPTPMSVVAPPPSVPASASVPAPAPRLVPKAATPPAGTSPPAAATTAPVPAEATHLGGYEVITRIAQGGMGSVYLCRRGRGVTFPRLFTLKAVRQHGPEATAVVRAFLREAQIGTLLTHPNVLPVLDMGSYDGQPFLILEYVEGASLADLLIAGQPTDPALVVAVILDTLRGLGAAHDAIDQQGKQLGLVHGDISPENILVGTDGAARLTDFGSARFTATPERPEEQGAPLVKPGYMSPEQLRGEPLDARSDLFALGVVMWTALTGQKAFTEAGYEQTVMNVLRKKLPPPSSSGAPKVLDEICLRALIRPREGRYQSAHDMAQELSRVAVAAGLCAGGRDVGGWVKRAIADVLVERRQHIQQAGSTTAAPVMITSEEPQAPPPAASRQVAGRTQQLPVHRRTGASAQRPERRTDPAGVPAVAPTDDEGDVDVALPRPRSVWLAVVAAAGLSTLATAGAMYLYFTSR